jgi:type IV pilus assembly protein PilV
MRPHSKISPSARAQAGVFLLEALLAILIFSIGILAVIGLQATSIKLAGDAKYRVDASMLAEELLAQMWVSDRVPATMAANFGSVAEGPAYVAWRSGVRGTLPGVDGNPPSVIIDTSAGTATTGTATVTVTWQGPTDALSHSHVVTAQIR